MRQLQLFGIEFVPKAIPAAATWPKKYATLKSEVRTGRSLGYPSSPIREEPETIQVGIPKPRTRRAAIYIPAERKLLVSECMQQEGGVKLEYTVL